MVIPFTLRKKKPTAPVNDLKNAFIFLQTFSGKQIILLLVDVQVETKKGETIVTGKSSRSHGRKGKNVAKGEVMKKTPQGRQPMG